jgi:hypothetical protein
LEPKEEEEKTEKCRSPPSGPICVPVPFKYKNDKDGKELWWWKVQNVGG